jgi:hypothetical protein
MLTKNNSISDSDKEVRVFVQFANIYFIIGLGGG